MATKPKTYQRGRDAITGRFVPLAQAQARPDTTIVQRVRIGRKPKPEGEE